MRKKFQNINKNWKEWDSTCLLDDGSIFCCFKSETFIIGPNEFLISWDSSQYSNRSGLIAVQDFVYMFGGIKNVALKFSLKSYKWTSLTQYPLLETDLVSCAALGNAILIGDHFHPKICIYNIQKNSYTLLPLPLNSCTGKTLLATKHKAYIIQYGNNYYESDLNDIFKWNLIGTTNVLCRDNARHSYPLLYEDSFYFITTDLKLIQFNLKNKELKYIKAV